MADKFGWNLRYGDNVIEADIPALDCAIQKRIRKAIEGKITLDPLRFGKPLRHSLFHLRSLRVGDYRVLYHVDHKNMIVSIVSVGHRSEIYDR